MKHNLNLIWTGSIIKNNHIQRVMKWKELNPSFNVFIWVDEIHLDTITSQFDSSINIKSLNEILALIPSSVLKLINAVVDSEDENSVPNYAAYSDVVRFYVLSNTPGWYVDTDVIPIHLSDISITQDFLINGSPWSICPDVMYIEQGSEAVEVAKAFFERLSTHHRFDDFINKIRGTNPCERFFYTCFLTGAAGSVIRFFYRDRRKIEKSSIIKEFKSLEETSWIFQETGDVITGIKGKAFSKDILNSMHKEATSISTICSLGITLSIIKEVLKQEYQSNFNHDNQPVNATSIILPSETRKLDNSEEETKPVSVAVDASKPEKKKETSVGKENLHVAAGKPSPVTDTKANKPEAKKIEKSARMLRPQKYVKQEAAPVPQFSPLDIMLWKELRASLLAKQEQLDKERQPKEVDAVQTLIKNMNMEVESLLAGKSTPETFKIQSLEHLKAAHKALDEYPGLKGALIKIANWIKAVVGFCLGFTGYTPQFFDAPKPCEEVNAVENNLDNIARLPVV